MLKELQQQLTGTPSSVFNKEDIDRFFGIQLMLCFVQSALEQLHTVVRYVESDSGQHSLMLTFDPATLIENQSSEKKTILLLEDREEMVWLITGLLSEEYLIHSVKSVQVAFEEIHRSVPAGFLVDMVLQQNRLILSVNFYK